MSVLVAACDRSGGNAIAESSFNAAANIQLPPAQATLEGLTLILAADIPALVGGKRLGGGPVSFFYDFHPGGAYVQFQDLGIHRTGRWFVTQDALCTILPHPSRGDQIDCRRFYRAANGSVHVADATAGGRLAPLVIIGDIDRRPTPASPRGESPPSR